MSKPLLSVVSHRELSLCIRRSCPTAHAGGPGSPALRMAELKVRRPDSSMACSVSCGSYDATRKVSPTPTVPKKNLKPGAKPNHHFRCSASFDRMESLASELFVCSNDAEHRALRPVTNFQYGDLSPPAVPILILSAGSGADDESYDRAESRPRSLIAWGKFSMCGGSGGWSRSIFIMFGENS